MKAMSFFQFLKGSGSDLDQTPQSDEDETVVDKIDQLDVDILQTEHNIIIYAQIAGVDINDINLSIEGDANIVLIEGRRTRPEFTSFPENDQLGVFFTEECIWGDFYRRIILPEGVVIEQAEAKTKNGVLILVLPLLNTSNREILDQDQP